MDTKVKTVKTTLKKAVDVIVTNFKEAKNQRPTKMGGAGNFMMSVIHWVSFDSPTDNFIENLFGSVENISSDKPVFIKLAYSPKNKKAITAINGFPFMEVQDGQHRIKFLKAIFNNAVSVPKEAPIEAYEWVSKEYGGKFFKELPEDLQRKFENITTILTIMETDNPADKAALFYSDNCGRAMSTKDMLNNNYCETEMWNALNNLISFVKSRRFIEGNEFKITRPQYEILHDTFAELSNNSMLNFFVRNMLCIDGWKVSNQSAICDEFFRENKNTSYKKSVNMLSTMAKQLAYTEKFFVCKDEGLTLYTAMISFAFGTLDKDGRKLLDKNAKAVSQEISTWCTIGVGEGKKPNESIFSYMSNTYYQISRVNKAKDFFNTTYNKLAS